MQTILCVEDEQILRQDIVDFLRDVGYVVVEASNGQEGLAAVIQHNPSLILCDIGMPGMDGLGMLAELREDEGNRHAHIPFVFLSARTDRNDIISAKHLGADDYIAKPVDFDLLLATVKARLAQMHRVNEKSRAELDGLRNSVLSLLPHELRTPLNYVIGFAEMIADGIHGPLGDPRYVEYVGYIRKGAEKLAEMIGGVLHLVEITTGAISPTSVEVDLHDMAAKILESFAADIAQGKLTATNNIPLGLIVRSDPVLLGRCIEGLFSNAVKFTQEGGHVELRTLQTEKELRVTVNDNGIGMDPAQLPIAYSLFGQLDSGLTRSYGGAGIGLPLSKAIAELLGSRLEVDTMLGWGTTVSLPLPGPGGGH